MTHITIYPYLWLFGPTNPRGISDSTAQLFLSRDAVGILRVWNAHGPSLIVELPREK